MNECPLITIAAVHGAALGGGAGLACACDLAIAEPGTTFGFPETRRGLVAAQIMPFLIRLFSSRVLNELLFLGETINTERALEIGLINKIATTHSVFAEALKFVDSIVLGAPQATANTKKLIRELEPVDFAKGFELGLTMHREGRQSKESKEGMQAFLEKRPPYWVKK